VVVAENNFLAVPSVSPKDVMLLQTEQAEGFPTVYAVVSVNSPVILQLVVHALRSKFPPLTNARIMLAFLAKSKQKLDYGLFSNWMVGWSILHRLCGRLASVCLAPYLTVDFTHDGLGLKLAVGRLR
jgi:hypothetical protein